jgi:hypothetical protein
MLRSAALYAALMMLSGPAPQPTDYQQCATVQGPPLVQEKHINGDAPVSPLV